MLDMLRQVTCSSDSARRAAWREKNEENEGPVRIGVFAEDVFCEPVPMGLSILPSTSLLRDKTFHTTMQPPSGRVVALLRNIP